ncbi:MAG: GNAT family N-acetyltransferase [Dehalococcoidia bacterium]
MEVTKETFDSLEVEWRELAAKTATPSVFGTVAWQRAWWVSCRSAEDLALLAFRTGGDVRGIAPLMRSGETTRFIAYSDLCDHHDFLVQAGAEAEFYPAFLDTVEAAGWTALEFDGLVEGSPTLELLPALARQRGWRVEQTLDEVSPVNLVPSTWEAYLHGLGKKDRHELRRKLRRLSAAGEVSCYDASRSDDLAHHLAVFLEMFKASREEKAAFLTASREQFFYRLADAMAGEGYLRLYFLELDGEKVAASLCFDYEGQMYLYNSGYNTKYASLSVGIVLKVLCIKEAIEQGRSRFHFLRGAESYKYHIGAQDCQLYRLVMQH